MKSPLLILAACFALGILMAHALAPDFHDIALLIAAASGCLLLGLISLRRGWIPLSSCLALMGFVVAGMAAGANFQYRFLPNDVHNLAGWGVDVTRDVETEGVIASNPIRSHNSFRFDLECRRIERDGEWRNVSGKIQVRLRIPANSQSWAALDSLGLRYGDLIEAPVRFEKPRTYRNPGSFDFRWWLEAIEDISWEGNIRYPRAVRKLAESQASRLSMLVQSVRSRLLHGIDRLYPPWSAEGRVGSVLKAVLLGDRSSLDSDTVENFRQSGLYHLLVISGLHVGLLASVVLFFLYLLRAGEAWRAGCLLIFLATFTLLVDQRAPTLRASLMIAAYLLARYLYRDRSALNAVGFAALVLLFHRPAWLFEAGFALSFSAALLIAGLALPILQRTTFPYRRALFHLSDVEPDVNLAPRLAQLRLELRMIVAWLRAKVSFLRRHPSFCEQMIMLSVRIVLWTADLVLFSAIIQVGLFMPMAETFHRITIIGIGLNTLAFPLMTLLIALAVPTVILAATVPILAVLPGKLLFWVTSALLALTEFRGEPLWMSYRTPGPPAWVAVGFALAVIAIALSLGRSRRALVVCGCLFITFAGLVVSYPFAPELPKGALEVTALDCGQGEALFTVLHNGATLLVDAGGREQFGPDIGRWNPGEDIVSPYLWSRGVKKIDIVVLGEGSDENIDAIIAILRNFKVRELWRSSQMPGVDALPLIATARERGVRIRDIAAEDSIGRDGEGIQVLWPSSVSQNKRLPFSDRSPVLRIMDRNGSALVRGDTDELVERDLAQSGVEFSSDVLESARPLSQIISQKKFLAKVNPAIVLKTGGNERARAARTYLHVGTLGSGDVPVFTTASDGAVTIDMKGSIFTVYCYGTSRIFTVRKPASRPASSSGL
jgi:competence protein ComEC